MAPRNLTLLFFTADCIDWVVQVANADERKELSELHKNRSWKELKLKIDLYASRLEHEKEQKVSD
jgi:hypothetical protein